jgi:hypothetical protein
MTIDDMVGRALTDLTEDLTPLPDPYGRAVLDSAAAGDGSVPRWGWAWWWRLAAGTILLPSRGGEPPVADAPSGWTAMHGWAERLADSPTRGTVGADRAFVADLADKIAERQRAGDYLVKAPVRQVKVLFVDDIGARRISFVAFALAQPDPTTNRIPPPTGSHHQAEALAAPSAVQSIGDGLGRSRPTSSRTM